MRDANKNGESQSESKQENETVENKPTNEEQLQADVESAAAEAEPMGSIAAAVPGDNISAQDVTEKGKSPGAESTVIRDQPNTTAGTEAKLEKDETGLEGKKSSDRKNAA